jgi:hypothetical protein
MVFAVSNSRTAKAIFSDYFLAGALKYVSIFGVSLERLLCEQFIW